MGKRRMNWFASLVWSGLVVGSGAMSAQVVEMPLHVERLDQRLDSIVPQDAKLERMTTGFGWVEGPVWLPGGYLLFADVANNSIQRLEPDGRCSVFMKPSGYLGKTLYGGSPGSNGMTLDLEGRLTIAGNATRTVFRMKTVAADAQQTVLADRYEGKRLNSPNDVVFRSDGTVYFTDPPYGLRSGKDSDPEKELKTNGVYLVRKTETRRDGVAPAPNAIVLLVDDLSRPNGIAFSPDERYLYVDNSEGKKVWLRFRVKEDGTLTDRKVLADASADKRPGSPDGMKVDSEGEIYSAGPGGVWILAPDGTHLGTIEMPEKVSNVAWGGAGLSTLYITATSSVYRVVLKTHGIPLGHREQRPDVR